jgi:ferredoxin, 2Fe-2S
MVSITFHPNGGQPVKVAGSEGVSVMETAVRNGVPGIEGECGGAMSCATCHVHVAPDWADAVGEPSGEESELLEAVDDLSERSRLGCQIQLRPELDGLEVTVP